MRQKAGFAMRVLVDSSTLIAVEVLNRLAKSNFRISSDISAGL